MSSLAAAAMAASVTIALASKPHIVFVLTDDLGWNTAWNNPDIHSPTLNAMAEAGVKLTSHYAYRYCSPSRAAFLTGRSAYKMLNVRDNLIPTTIPECTDQRFTMLPKRLKEAGYHSYQIGKWHQGMSNMSMTPVGRGFQESLGFLQGGADHYTQIGQGSGSCPGWGSVTDYFAQGGDYPMEGAPAFSCDVPIQDRNVCPLFKVISANTSVAKATELCSSGAFSNCAFDEATDEVVYSNVGNGGCNKNGQSAGNWKKHSGIASDAACRDLCTSNSTCGAYAYCSGSNCAGNCNIYDRSDYDGGDGYPAVECYVKESSASLACFQCKTKIYTGYTFTDHAVSMIERHPVEHPNNPMFMYLALHNTHAPSQAPDEFKALYNFPDQRQSTFDAMVSVVDSTVKNVTDALHRSGMWENTLLIWTTDNGSPSSVSGSNAPLKGSKGSAWEGGCRVPAFVSGGILPRAMAGRTLDGIVGIWDYFATFCALAGVDPAEPNPANPSPVDSFDLWPYLSGKVAASPRTELVYDHLRFSRETTACIYGGDIQVAPCDGAGAIRVGDYKLLVGIHGWAGHYGHFSPNTSWQKGFSNLTQCSMEAPCLFNVTGDMEEQYDLAMERPEVVSRLLERFNAYDAEYHPPTDAPPNEQAQFCEAALNNGGFLTPWHKDAVQQVAIGVV